MLYASNTVIHGSFSYFLADDARRILGMNFKWEHNFVGRDVGEHEKAGVYKLCVSQEKLKRKKGKGNCKKTNIATY